MKIFRARHDNMPESSVCTLYGRKGNLLLAPLDICILVRNNGVEEFRPPSETARLIAAPIQELGGGRLGLIAQYEWSLLTNTVANPVVTVQLAPSANVKGVLDLRVLASQLSVGDNVYLAESDVSSQSSLGVAPNKPEQWKGRIEGCIVSLSQWHEYPDLTHRVRAIRVEFEAPIDRTLHGSAVWHESGGLAGMLISTDNQSDGTCRALVYPA